MTAPAPIYIDYNAGAPLRPQARAAMAAAPEGNPSSVHATGRRAKAALEAARETIAAALAARPGDLVLTSGATEALHLAVRGARAAGAACLIVSALEHDALALAAAQLFPGALTIPALADGVIDLAALEALLAQAPRPALVALMAANNETGAIQPLREAAAMVREAGGLLLVDAAQVVGRMPADLGAIDASYLVASSHKIGGPAGAGALALSPGAPFTPPAGGGGQERGRRPGTENVAAACGFAAAMDAASLTGAGEIAAAGALRDAFERDLRARFPEAVIFAETATRLANTSLFALPGLPAETAVIGLDLAGVMVSAGAACSSGKVRASRVLAAMGAAPALAGCAVRASFGWASGAGDAGALLDALEAVYARTQRRLKGAA